MMVLHKLAALETSCAAEGPHIFVRCGANIPDTTIILGCIASQTAVLLEAQKPLSERITVEIRDCATHTERGIHKTPPALRCRIRTPVSSSSPRLCTLSTYRAVYLLCSVQHMGHTSDIMETQNKLTKRLTFELSYTTVYSSTTVVLVVQQ